MHRTLHDRSTKIALHTLQAKSTSASILAQNEFVHQLVNIQTVHHLRVGGQQHHADYSLGCDMYTNTNTK